MDKRIKLGKTYVDPRSGLQVVIESLNPRVAVARHLNGPLMGDRVSVPEAVWTYGLDRGTCVLVQT